MPFPGKKPGGENILSTQNSAAICGAIAFALIVAPASAQEQAAETQVYRLDTIEVSAGKRPQRLGEVDATVTVRTAEELRQANVTKVQDLDKVFPGLVIRTRGNRAYSNITLRGVTSPDFYNPAVQVYVDGIPQDSAYFTQELLNVEQVELLRGPQGTLYGKNAHGGVLNIVTRKPGNAAAAHAGASGSTGGASGEARVAGPILPDTLFGEFALRLDREFGQVDDIATGEDNIDDAKSGVGRAKLRFAPAGKPIDITLTAQHEKLRSHEELYIRESLIEDRQFDSATQGGLPLLDRQVSTLALSGSYDFKIAKVTSITSYQDREMVRFLSGRNTPEDQTSIAQELRASFELGDLLKGVLGGFFQDTDFTRNDPGFTGFFGSSVNNVETQSYALFGEATYAVTDTIDLTGGLRWSREDASINYARAAPSAFSFSAEDSFDDISPKVSLGWQLLPDHRLYAVASRGFKPGGFNHTVSNATDQVPYASETSTNLELGWRGGLFDGLADLNADIYWIKAQDKQIFVGPLGSQVIRNVGDSESYGFELDAQIHPASGLTVTAGAAIGRSVFEDAVDPQTGADYDGNRLPYAPDRMFQLGARYVIPQAFLKGDVSVRGAGRYYSRTYFNETNSLSQSGYTIVDASIDLDLRNGFTLSLFAENITDELYRTSSFAFGANDIRSTIGEGRVVGVAGRYVF